MSGAETVPTQLGQFNVAEVFHFLFYQIKLLLFQNLGSIKGNYSKIIFNVI